MKTWGPIKEEPEKPLGSKSVRECSSAGESKVSAAGTTNKANRAVKDTARKYLDAAGFKIDLDDIESRIRKRPLFCPMLAVSAGFITGGGLATDSGEVLLGRFGRKVAVDTATNFARQILTASRQRREVAG